MPVERAAGCVVAHNPVLVRTTRLRHKIWIAPVDPIRRPAHRDRRAVADRQRRDEPHPMQRVISYRRIARRLVSPVALKDRDPRQKSIRPVRAAVRSSSEADIGASSSEDARHLERRYRGRSPGKRAWFHLGSVLAGSIGECIFTQLNQIDLRCRKRHQRHTNCQPAGEPNTPAD